MSLKDAGLLLLEIEQNTKLEILINMILLNVKRNIDLLPRMHAWLLFQAL